MTSGSPNSARSKQAAAADQETDALLAATDDTRDASEHLILDLDGFEGPIDLLLSLAREQKVDLREISILQLADQYLTFIRSAQDLRLELAADYLVMAAWLAFLKSKMLIPEVKVEGESSGPMLAEELAFQLRRLDAMRNAAENLFARALLGEKRFVRGAPEGVPIEVEETITATLYDLLKAYARQRGRIEGHTVSLAKAEIFGFEAAIQRLSGFVGKMPDWSTLEAFLPDDIKPGLQTRSAIASTFLAGLQLVRQGKLEMRQDAAFAPIHMRSNEAYVAEQSARMAANYAPIDNSTNDNQSAD